MQCPLCKSKDLKPKLKQPIIYGGTNAVEYCICKNCGILFVETENNKVSIPSLHTKEDMDERLKSTNRKKMWTGIKDSQGVDIYNGCTMVFADKAEWYNVDIFKARLGGDKKVYQEVMTDHVKYPYEKRVVELPGDYEWLLSEEIQRYWIVEDESKPVAYSQETEG